MNKYYNPSKSYLSGREYEVVEKYNDGSWKIKFPSWFGEEVIARPKDLDGTYKAQCEAIWKKEKNMVARANGWK